MPKGDIVLISFPFTDLSGSKLRPAVSLTDTTLDHLTIALLRHKFNGRSRQT